MKQQLVKLGKVAITVDKNYWAITKDYDRLVMVKRQSTGVVYISRKPVPAGIEITNRDYWLSFNIGGADSTTVVNLVQEFGGDPEVAISQKVITEKIEEIEAAIASIDSNSGGHNILPFDGFVTILNRNAISNQKYTSSSQVVTAEYTIVAERTINAAEKFYLKVEDTYYTNWEITTEIPITPVVGGDPITTPEPGVVSKSEWYYTEYRTNKLFYNRSNKVVYCYNYATSSLAPITNIQVVEENAPEADSTSNPNNSTKGSIIVDLENDKLLTWDGNKWKELSGGGNSSTPIEIPDVPNNLAIRNGKLYLEVVSTGQEPVVLSEVNLPAGGGQTVLVQSSEDSPSIVRLDANTSKLGKKVIPLGTSAANLFKHGVRENDSDVYNSTTYSSDDGTRTVYHIKYEFDLQGTDVEIPANSTLKFEGGCIKDSGRIVVENGESRTVYGSLIGENIKVEVDGSYTIFDNVTFYKAIVTDNPGDYCRPVINSITGLQVTVNGVPKWYKYCHFVNSKLYATNFGAIGNMESVSKYLTFKNLDNLPIKERTRLVNGAEELNYDMAAGTESHDFTCFKHISELLTFSSNIYLTLNGDFYVARLNSDGTSYESWSGAVVRRANNLTIEGGTTTVGWRFYDCNNVTLQNTNYVGFHEIHEFPYIATTNEGTYTENGESKNYSDLFVVYIDDSENSLFGLANRIRFSSEDYMHSGNIDTYICPTGFNMRNCHLEMRDYGADLGQTHKDDAASTPYGDSVVKNCCIENCEFDHIKVQVLSLHGVWDSRIDSCTINYCGCPIDIASACKNVIAENITAIHCGIGIKCAHATEGENPLPCGNNIVRNLKITMDDIGSYRKVTTGSKQDDYYIVRTIDSRNLGYICRFENCTFTSNRDEGEPIGAKGSSNMPKAIMVEANTQFVNCTFDFGKVKGLFIGKFNENDNSTIYRTDIVNCKINIVDDTDITNLFKDIHTLNISSSVIDYKDDGSSKKAPSFSSNVASLNIENSELYFRKGTSMGMDVADNFTFKQNRVLYNHAGGSYMFKLPSNAIVENNTFDVTIGNAVFTIANLLSNIKLNKNIITTNGDIIRIANYTVKETVDGELVNVSYPGNVDGIEVKDNIVNYTGTGSVTNVTPVLLNFGESTNVIVDGNIFKGTRAKRIADFPTYNTTIIGSLVDDKSRNTFDNIPAANSVRQRFIFYDTTNNRFLISDGTQWIPIGSRSSEDTPVTPVAPAYGAAENIPQTAQLGTRYFDTTNNVMKVYNGSAWVSSIQQVIPDSAGTSYNTDVPNAGVGYLFRVTSANNEIRMKLRSTGQLWQALPLTNDCIVVSGSGEKGDFDTTDYTQTKQIYYATDEGKYYLWYPSVEGDRASSGLFEIPINHIALSSGTFNNAPDINEVVLGYTYYDTARQKLLTAKSEGWTDNDGNVISVPTKGTTAQRPAATDITEGFKYYNTQIHKEQVYNGSQWVDIEDAASTGIRIDSLVPDVVTGSALSTTLAADINKYYRYDSPVDTLAVTLPELVSSSKVQNVVVYLTAGSNADSTTITFAAATPTEGVAAPVYYQKSYDIEAGKTYEINALYNGAAWIVAAVEIVTAVPQSSNASNNSLLMGGFTPLDNNSGNAETPDVEPDDTETI